MAHPPVLHLVRRSRRIPARLPFVMRHSRAKMGLLLLLAVLVAEIGLAIAGNPAGTLSSLWVQVVIIAIFGLAWVITTVGPTFAMSLDGVWVTVRPWPRSLVVFVPWDQVDRIGDARYQWHVGLAVSLRDPSVLNRQMLGTNIGRLVAQYRKQYGGDLSVSLTLADRSTAEVAQALGALAPATVERRIKIEPPAPRTAHVVRRWAGRIVLGVAWVSIFLFVVPVVATNLFRLGDTEEKIAAFVSATVGVATMPALYTAYERSRGRR